MGWPERMSIFTAHSHTRPFHVSAGVPGSGSFMKQCGSRAITCSSAGMPIVRSLWYTRTLFIGDQPSASPCMRHIGGVFSSNLNSGARASERSLPFFALFWSRPSARA